jgi:hypothetical protein
MAAEALPPMHDAAFVDIADVFSYANGVRVDPITLQLRAGGAPCAEVVAAHTAAYSQQQRSFEQLMVTPGSELYVTSEARDAGVRDDVAAALAEAYAQPVPLWLCIHLWRNGISRAAFQFQLQRGGRRGVGAVNNAAALREFAADLRELYTQPVPDTHALARTMHRLRREFLRPRVPRAAAEDGPLPEKYELLFLFFAEGRMQSPVLEWSFELPLNTADMAQLVAYQETHFIAPANPPANILPYEITICRGGNDAAAAAAAADVATGGGGRQEVSTVPMSIGPPCQTCGGSVSTPLYFRDSPTWRAMRRTVRTYDATPSTINRLPPVERMRGVTECRCGRCDACGAKTTSLKKCGACARVAYCCQDCQRAHWPEHREECRRHRGGAGAAQQAA